jgi:hypothetical protein
MPAVFQALMEAAGISGSRDAWVALSTVAIAFSIGSLDFEDDGVLQDFENAALNSSEKETIDVQALARSDHADSWDIDPNAADYWPRMNVKSADKQVRAEAEHEDTDKTTIIARIEIDISETGITASDKSYQQPNALATNIGPSTGIEFGSPQNSRPWDESNDAISFPTFEKQMARANVVQSSEVTSDAHSLVNESIEITSHTMRSDFLNRELMNAITTAFDTDERPSDYFTAEINVVDESLAITGLDTNVHANYGPTHTSETDGTVSTNEGLNWIAMKALEWFAQSHPDFKVVTLGRNIVVFDWSNINQVQVSLELHTWTLHDGSTVNIIGTLPDALTMNV